MKNQEEPKALKALYIVGSGISISDDVKTMFGERKEDCLIIGDGSVAITEKYIKSTLGKENFKITKDTRIDIEAHGCRTNDKQHAIRNNSSNPEGTALTKQLFQNLREIADCPLYVHLWSCYGGSANKVVSSLGNNSILVTHTENKENSSVLLGRYSITASLERYLKKDLTPYDQFILGLPKNFQKSTFNKVKTDGKTTEFIRMRTPEKKKMPYVLEKISPENNLTYHFNNFFTEEGERFQGIFKDVNVAGAIKFVSELDDKSIQTFAIGILIQLYAITKNDELSFLEKVLDKLSQKGISINDSIYGMTPLHFPCYKENINVVEMLLQHKANTDVQDVNGNTPLHYACLKEGSGVVATLLAHKADLNIKGMNGNTPLHYACQKGLVDIVATLLAHKADPNIKNIKDNAPLHYACQKGLVDIVATLLVHKADPNIKGMNGNTPLHWACGREHINAQTVKMLLECYADPNIQNINGTTPLHLLSHTTHIDIVEMLLTHNASPNIKDTSDNTPLHLACQKGNIEVIKELLKNSTIFDSLTIKNNDGKTPVELIPEANKEAIVSLIAEAEKSMHSKDKNLALDKPEDINNLSVNQQMPKDNSEQLSNNEPQTNPELTELAVLGHVGYCHADYSPCA